MSTMRTDIGNVYWEDQVEGSPVNPTLAHIRSFMAAYNNATHQTVRDEMVQKTRAFVDSLGDEAKDLKEKMTYPDAKGVWTLKI